MDIKLPTTCFTTPQNSTCRIQHAEFNMHLTTRDDCRTHFHTFQINTMLTPKQRLHLEEMRPPPHRVRALQRAEAGAVRSTTNCLTHPLKPQRSTAPLSRVVGLLLWEPLDDFLDLSVGLAVQRWCRCSTGPVITSEEVQPENLIGRDERMCHDAKRARPGE
ncbi:hypothetical protein FOCC_FOCC002956 [Frankliniella occidentalis]|nr:hypothetical protein FOCC_FOCC002956 [Frankliniella occidentalis]